MLCCVGLCCVVLCWVGLLCCVVLCCVVLCCAKGAVTRRQWPGCLPKGTGKREGCVCCVRAVYPPAYCPWSQDTHTHNAAQHNNVCVVEPPPSPAMQRKRLASTMNMLVSVYFSHSTHTHTHTGGPTPTHTHAHTHPTTHPHTQCNNEKRNYTDSFKAHGNNCTRQMIGNEFHIMSECKPNG